MSAIVNIIPAVKTVNLTKDNFVAWDKYYVLNMIYVHFRLCIGHVCVCTAVCALQT